MTFTRVLWLTFSVGLCSGIAQDLSERFYQTIRSNNIAELRTMVANGSDINSRDRNAATPLMHAAAFGSMDAMKALLAARADVNAKNAFDATALMWAVYDLDKTRLLVDAGADVNAKSKMGRTPLMIAAAYDGNREVVKLLLAKGADLKARDRMGETVLTMAADGDVAGILVEHGAAVNAADEGGMTPLMTAASAGDVTWTRMLLQKGADVKAVSTPSFGPGVKNGPIALGSFTALLLAAPYGSPELVKLLLDAGADVNARDVRGMTPLMLAIGCDHNNPRSVRLLLDRGADPKLKSKAGEDAYAWARKVGSAEVMRALGVTASARPEPLPAITLARGEAPNVAAVVQKSVALMQRTTGTFFTEGGCASCHAHNMTDMVIGAVQTHGIRIDPAAAAEHGKQNLLGWAAFEQLMLQRLDPPGTSDRLEYGLLGMAAAGQRPNHTTDAMVFDVAALQLGDGSWHSGGVARPPIEDSDFTRTAMAVRALQQYGMPGRGDELDRRIARAREWLLRAAPITTEDHNMRLLGLIWAAGSSESIAGARSAVAALQRPDGGWAQTRDLTSDAYATGQALYALSMAGLVPAADTYRRGVTYLLTTQLADGSWHVASRAPKFQPYFQSGFPHDHDQWISAMATGWAILGLAPAIESPPVPQRDATARAQAAGAGLF